MSDAHKRAAHWERVYRERAPDEVSWYASHLRLSLRLIREVSTPAAALIDVGGGASTLVDDLLDLGYRRLTVLDISAEALERARRRLGERASRVTWLGADITSAALPAASYDVWHDRAVFHFLTAASDRAAYLQNLRQALTPSGHVVISTFSLQGPPRCSGLDVVRYDAEGLQKALGREFTLTASEESEHVTPAGKSQHFVTCSFQRAGAEPT